MKINLMDVKTALLDSRFRESLPESLTPDIQKFLGNPGCNCNHGLYKKVAVQAAEQLKSYFPSKEPISIEEIDRIETNEWTVINCNVDELQSNLRKLPPGRKQVEVARYQDQVTVVICQLDSNF